MQCIQLVKKIIKQREGGSRQRSENRNPKYVELSQNVLAS